MLYSGEVGRNLLGVVKAVGEGTVEKAIPRWTSELRPGQCRFHADGGKRERGPSCGRLELRARRAGPSLTAEPGKEVAYIWFERFVKEREA
ncbi:MAG: hypothetical protein ACLR7U_07030 [Ruthenibacterium lactatiformans]